jgi:twitching motility two-component system response regulator PilH
MPTVVIADDSPTWRRIVTSVLTKEGFEIVPAEDGVSAVQAVFQTMPDAVVLDVQMPRVSGYVAARLLKDDWQTADIPVILLTSLDAASDRYWGAQTGADRYFTKDFEAPQLVAAVREVIEVANAATKGRPLLRPDPIDLSDDDVLSRVCDLLDRKLFETSVAAEVTSLAATTHGFEQTVAGVLDVLKRFVDYDLASVILLEERTAYVAVAQETSQAQYSSMLNAAVDSLSSVSGLSASVADLELRLADPTGLLGEEDERDMATFLSMPLKGHGGHVIGLVALSSGQKNAFGETALATLRLVDGPAALVIDNARLADVRAAAASTS